MRITSRRMVGLGTVGFLVALFAALMLDFPTPPPNDAEAVWKYRPSGVLLAEGTQTWTLDSLETDPDSSVYGTPIATAVGNLRAGSVTCGFVWSGAVGGSTDTTTEVEIMAYGYEAAGDSSGGSVNRTGIYLGDYDTAPAQTYTVNLGATAAGSKPFLPGVSVGSNMWDYNGPFPPYIAFRLDKDGGGQLTAGTMTVYWRIYSK